MCIRDSSDIAPERIEWLWQGRVAIGKLTLIAGEPGLGKSQITLRVAATVTNGDKWPNCENDHAPTGSVIILSADDGLADTTRPRFDAAGWRMIVFTIRPLIAIRDRRRNAQGYLRFAKPRFAGNQCQFSNRNPALP